MQTVNPDRLGAGGHLVCLGGASGRLDDGGIRDPIPIVLPIVGELAEPSGDSWLVLP